MDSPASTEGEVGLLGRMLRVFYAPPKHSKLCSAATRDWTGSFRFCSSRL